MTRFALGLQYDGASWQGFQSQPSGVTVQDALEAALTQFADAPVRVTAAGRTDAGVHALGQVVHFDSSARRRDDGWVRGTNSLLPASVAVRWAAPVPDTFHARFSALARTYAYVLYVDPVRSPHLEGRAGWCFRPLDLERMRAAVPAVLGEHDFSALRSAECQARSPVKTIESLTLSEKAPFVVCTVRANAFLHHMVRNLVGCLVAIGTGRQRPEWLAEVIASGDRARAAPTFAAGGLYFLSASYPDAFELPPSPGLESVFPGL